jgi:transcriptional regulator GlxA family with amidase domain
MCHLRQSLPRYDASNDVGLEVNRIVVRHINRDADAVPEWTSMPRRVVIIAFPGVNLLDLAGPAEVFSSLAEAMGRENGEDEYAIEVASTTGEQRVRTSGGVSVFADRAISEVKGAIDTLLIPGGTGVWAAAQSEANADQLRRIVSQSRRVASICTGSFLLAAAGLLDGRRATTHWRWCGRLAAQYPNVAVEPDSIFVRDGTVYTSAGVTSGMDLALALVEEDLGRAAALQIARHLVMFVRRPGGQSQFSPLLEMQAADRQALRDLQAWISEHLAEDLSVDSLAEQAHMSSRNFARVFQKEIGTTPARFVERLRIDAVRRRLEECDVGLDRIAGECGFGSADAMRRAFLRVLHVPPSDYRDRFRAMPGA